MKNAQELKAIYGSPSFKAREQVARFDDGGSYYDAVNFANPTEPQYVTPTAQSSMSGLTSGLPTSIDPSVTNAAPPTANLLTNSQVGNPGDPNAAAGAPANTGGLGNILGPNTGSLLTAALGVLSAAGHYAQSKGAATLPAMPAQQGFGSSALPALPGANGSNGFGPAGGYNFGNYSGVSSPGLGYAPRTQAPAMPMSSYYTYGQGPEHQFFTPVNAQTGVAPPTGQKKGGRVKKHAIGGAISGLNTQNPMLGSMQSAVPGTAFSGPAQQPMLNQMPNAPAPTGLQATGALQGTPGGPMMAPNPVATSTGFMAGPVKPMIGPQKPTVGPPTGIQASMQQAVNPAPRPVAPQMPARPAPAPTMPMARPMPQPMRTVQPMPANRNFMAADGGQPDKTSYANTWGQWTPPNPAGQAQSNVTGAPARGALSDVIPHRAMVGHAQGGAMPHGQGPQTMSRHVRGPGDGTSDSIPARLANGEYVLSADVVSGLGNGDNGSGAKRLDQFVHNVRVHKAQNASQGKLPADAKPIPHYMGGQS
jgi:hypothetical protein